MARSLPSLWLVALWACSGPTRAAPRPEVASPAGRAPAPRERAPAEQQRTVVSLGRVSGTSVITPQADGSMHSVVQVLENGRGPYTEATYRLADDGTFAWLRAQGHHEFGAQFTAELSRQGGRVTWRSPEERGEVELDEPALYVPVAELPEIDGYLVRAALLRGGRMRTLPSGEVRVQEIARVTVSAGGAQRALVGYSLHGLGLSPDYTWMNEDGTWFGSVSEWYSTVPSGWETVIDQLVELQRGKDRTWRAGLAQRLAQRPPAAGLAYTHARVLDLERGRWLPDHTVVVVGERIAAVGPSGGVTPPAGAKIVDLAGKAIVPGLIDMHVHLDDADGLLHLAAGVTTVRDVGNDPDRLDELTRTFDDGSAIGPRVVRFGLIEGRGEKAASSEVTAETVDEARAAVKLYAERGYDGIKIYSSVRPALVPVLVAEAHRRGLKVTGHVPVHLLARDVVEAGFDGVEHINMLLLNFFATRDTDTRDTTRFTLVGERGAELDLRSPPVTDFLRLLSQRGTVLTPTVNAFEDLLVWQQGEVEPALVELAARLPLQAQRVYIMGGLPADAATHRRYVAGYGKMLELVRAMVDAKLKVTLGTDALAGLMYLHEARLFARAGVPPAQILRIASADAARYLGLESRLGSIAAGKLADLVIVDGDPLARIEDLGRTVEVMRGGVAYSCDALYEALSVRPWRAARR